jgi:uncharacterized protein YbbC (DUF1343 family)
MHETVWPPALALPQPNRRHLLSGLSAAVLGTLPLSGASAVEPAVVTGAAAAAANGFNMVAGRRVGLITNQTGRIGSAHLADIMARAGTFTLAAIFAPEHGFRGAAEAGASVADGRDTKTGVEIRSLYGATKAPTAAMLRDIDVLVFDIQDIGARFYTYISTMGLAMQAAATRGIPFVVLDRPNPLGGTYVSGFVLEPRHRSFVGQYPIPIVHGMTIAELARMIQGERLLTGLERLDLQIVPLKGWRRTMRFPATRLPWVATSPNIPTFEAALVYPGIGMVGETLVNEGRGTPTPFLQFGAPWLDAARMADDLNQARLPGVNFAATRYIPRAIPNVAATPRFRDVDIPAVRVQVTRVDVVQPLEIGMHALALLVADAKRASVTVLPDGAMFTAIAGTTRLRTLLDQGATGPQIIASWQNETAAFKTRRQRYLLY